MTLIDLLSEITEELLGTPKEITAKKMKEYAEKTRRLLDFIAISQTKRCHDGEKLPGKILRDLSGGQWKGQ